MARHAGAAHVRSPRRTPGSRRIGRVEADVHRVEPRGAKRRVVHRRRDRMRDGRADDAVERRALGDATEAETRPAGAARRQSDPGASRRRRTSTPNQSGRAGCASTTPAAPIARSDLRPVRRRRRQIAQRQVVARARRAVTAIFTTSAPVAGASRDARLRDRPARPEIVRRQDEALAVSCARSRARHRARPTRRRRSRRRRVQRLLEQAKPLLLAARENARLPMPRGRSR